jgi:hypothetical protein
MPWLMSTPEEPESEKKNTQLNKIFTVEISDFCCCVVDVFALLRCYVV